MRREFPLPALAGGIRGGAAAPISGAEGLHRLCGEPHRRSLPAKDGEGRDAAPVSERSFVMCEWVTLGRWRLGYRQIDHEAGAAFGLGIAKDAAAVPSCDLPHE